MAKRAGPFSWLALGFLVALVVMGSSASAYKIVWKATGGTPGGRTGCNTIVPSGEVATTETSMTIAAVSQAFSAIYSHSPPSCGATCCVDTDGCDKNSENWEARVCNDGSWQCRAGYGSDRCDVLERVGAWAVIAADSCGDGYCTGAETQCACPADCGTASYCPVCGNGILDTGEQCELAGTSDNSYCSQTTSQCQGTILGTRDAYGNCNSTCGCAYDPFTYSCVKGQCGAACSSSSDCSLSTCSQTYNDYCSGSKLIEYNYNGIMDYVVVSNSTPNTCTSSCSCTVNPVACPAPPTTASCIKGVCGAACASNPDCPDYCSGNIRYYSGTCTSGCACIYSQQDCGSTATCSAGTCVPKPLLSVSAAVSPSAINVGGQATLSGVVACSNADCGTVYVYPKGSLNEPLDTVAGLSVTCIAGNVNCYFSCQTMAAGQTCHPSWAIKGINKGTYPMFLNVISQTVSGLSNQSSTVSLSVTEIPAGTVTVTLSASPAVVTVGSSSIISAYVSCSGVSTAQCGNVTSYLTSSPSGLSASPPTPQKPLSCTGLKAGQSCSANWTAISSAQGLYYLYAVADSDNPNVTNATGNAVLNVTDRPVLQITNISLPSQIKLGETASLSAHIICQSNAFACGTVAASLRYNGTAGLSIQNPEKECGSMAPSSVCPVSWSITGNTAAAYRLEISANSSSSLVVNASAARVLAVSKNLGSLSVSAANPAKIDLKTSLTNSTTLTAVINCSTDYCGSVNVTLWSEGVLLSPSTTVSVQQNQQACSSFPCSREWTLKSSSEGYYQITILAKSNESIEAGSSPTLVVEGYFPLLGLASNLAEIRDSRTGQAVQINATISCHTKRCGQVTAALAHDSGGWSNLPSGSVYFVPYSQQNPVIISEMVAGQSSEVSWTVNFAETGSYQLGIFANGSAENITNAYVTENISVSSVVGNVEILSPAAGATYSRGDDVSLRALVTADGKPLAGLSPFVSQLEGATLHDAGNGIYEGSGKIPHDAGGQYDLVFRAGEYEAPTYIFVDPALSVTAYTDKQSYGWGENITITGKVTKSGQPASSDIRMELFMMGKKQVEASFHSIGDYLYTFTNKFAVSNQSRLEIKLTATDEHGNNGEGSTEAVLEAFQGSPLSVTFNMQKYNWSRGESIPISVKVTQAGSFRQGLVVKCSLRGSEITLEEMGGQYQGYYPIPPESETGNVPLYCAVQTEPGDSIQDISIEPMDLKISVVDPKMLPNNIMYVFSENFTVLSVEVRNPDGTPVTDAVLQVTVGGKTTNMTHIGGGSYKAEVMFTGSGVSEMLLAAEDPRGNHGGSSISLVVNPSQFNWWWLLLIPLGMGILFALWIYKKSKEPPNIQIQEKIIRLPTVERVREVIYRPVKMPQAARPRVDPETRLRGEISRLEEKSRTTQEAKELAEQQYYKRQIDEATFNKLMQDYEEKLIETDAALRQKRKELSEA